MPVRKRRVWEQPAEQPRRRTRQRKAEEWVQDGSRRYRKGVYGEDPMTQPPRDDYYYVSFPIANARQHAGNMQRMGETGLPFEYAKSPSGCYCYRIHRDYGEDPKICRRGDWDDGVPCFMPGHQDTGPVEWRMHQLNWFPYLYKKWYPVPPVEPTGRRRRRQVEEPPKRRKRKRV